MSKSMKHAQKVNKWLEGAAPSLIPPPLFSFPFSPLRDKQKLKRCHRAIHLASFLPLCPSMQQTRLLTLSLHSPEMAHAEITAEPGIASQGAEER